MINTILIDDEYLALEKFKFQLKKFDIINIKETFTNPELALTYVFEEKDIQLVIVDIQMPQMTGIEFSEKVREKAPWIHVVFSTAYEEYAVQAFGLDICDYLLKPSSLERIEQMIRKVEDHIAIHHSDKTTTEVTSVAYISLFKHFELTIDDKINHINWRTSKVKELFIYFLCHLEMPIRKEYLIEVLWPEHSLQSGVPLLNTTMYNLRKSLKPYELDFKISYTTGSYIASVSNIELDIYQLDKLNKSKHSSKTDIKTISDAINLYKGQLLEIEGYSWTETLEQKYLSIFRNITMNGLMHYKEASNQNSFKEVAEAFISVDYYDDGIWEMYLRGLMEFGNVTKAMTMYIEYKKSLMKEYNMKPSFQL